jgi:membrane-associated phospholipid phosphatase
MFALHAQTSPSDDSEKVESASTGKAAPADSGSSAATEAHSKHGAPKVLSDLLSDQKFIWTSPARLRFSDTSWLVPLGGITAGLFVTDRQYSASLSNSSSTIGHYKTVSNVGIAGLIGAGAGMYLFSFPTHNEHWRETGWLAGQAAVNSLLVVEAMKYSFGRERPYQNNGSGAFFQGGTSFPSEHAAAAWSVAGVIAHEYPGILPKIAAYGAATMIDYARIHGKQHFPSDVLVGSTLGYLIANAVYNRHHDPELSGDSWGPPSDFIDEDARRKPQYMGSPYVPLESWVYPALERLGAMGYVKTASLGIRPWTRLACARLVAEAGEYQVDTDGPPEAQQMYEALTEEFSHEFGLMSGDRNLHAELESVYMRSLGISGTPLTDNYHFGQTILNDYGRPYQEGFSSATGASGWAAAGPFVFYVRGEYQSAPSAPSPSQQVLDFITRDGLPPNPPQTPVAAVHRFQLLDAYVAMNLSNWQLSYGQQTQWWGASESGPFMFTNNVAPLTNMFRVDRVTPFRLPWIFKLLGNIRLQAFIGQEKGVEFIRHINQGVIGPDIGSYGVDLYPQPFIFGEKFSFKFTENFEFNISKTAIYGGPGNPLTLKTFYYATLGKKLHGDDLGDGRSGVDFSYRVPKLRNWLTFYGDAFTEDEISPLAYPRKSAFSGGLYFSHVPKLPKLDLRIEGGTTSPVDYPQCVGCFYTNGEYVSGYTNDKRLIGSWIGRAAQGEWASANYWLNARNKIGLDFRHRQIDAQYLPQGGAQTDFGAHAQFFMKSGFSLSGQMQYERWNIPLLASQSQSNFSVSFQLGYLASHRAHP